MIRIVLKSRYRWETSHGDRGIMEANSMRDAANTLLKYFAYQPNLEILVEPEYNMDNRKMIVKVKEGK